MWNMKQWIESIRVRVSLDHLESSHYILSRAQGVKETQWVEGRNRWATK